MSTEVKNMRKLLYTPSGRAGAYANGGFAANIYKGCTHGCLYCYVPSFCHLDRATFHDSVESAPNVLERLERDLSRVGILSEPIFLSFTCDPYPEDGYLSMLTREVIKMINNSGNAVNILTKGGTRAVRDFDLLAMNSKNKIGATLTFENNKKSMTWEPGATLPTSRLTMLQVAHSFGIQTWASIEPVIEPAESLAIMSAAICVVDEFKIGKWNHDERANKINWRRFLDDARELMLDNSKTHTIKQDLLDAAHGKP